MPAIVLAFQVVLLIFGGVYTILKKELNGY